MASDPRVNTGHRLTAARRERMLRGLRLSDVAAGARINIATLSLIERGLREPSAVQKERLERFYGKERVA